MTNCVILLLFFLITTLQLNTPCASNVDCPSNSTCINSYCQCNSPYIMDCQTPAPLITNNLYEELVQNFTTYAQTQNQKPEVYYSFLFQVCLNTILTSQAVIDGYNLFFQLYVNTGSIDLNQSSVGNVTTKLSQLVNNGQCVDFVQYQIKLEKQVDGQTENLIIGLEITPLSPSNFIDSANATIGIKVNTKQLVSSELLIKLAIGIISFAVFVALCIIGFCCYQRYKKKKQQQERLTYQQQQVELFKKNTPQLEAKLINIPAMTTCSICLGDFQPENKIRKTVCKHLFHSECIDSWCQKNLSCPVCRLDLDQVSIKQKQKQIQMTTFRWNQNSLSGRDELLQNIQPNQTGS